MDKAICTVSVAPVRAENSHKSEMVSQILYGESVEIIDVDGSFSKIKFDFDGYEGWVDTKQIAKISPEDFALRKTETFTKPYDRKSTKHGEMLISIGSEIESENPQTPKFATPEMLAETALQFLNVPYLWSGRSFFGIDCSGFTQIVYKVNGISLPRDAYQQAEVGRVLDFVEESQPGDLAFFDNEEGKITHVGLMLESQKIIHAYGKVRIDILDSTGIFNKELNRHTHKLRFVKTLI